MCEKTPPCPEAVKWERNVLADALAEIASAVVGGESATREEMAMDVEAAVAEGSDPLPKRTDSWAQFHYGQGGGDLQPETGPYRSAFRFTHAHFSHSLLVSKTKNRE